MKNAHLREIPWNLSSFDNDLVSPLVSFQTKRPLRQRQGNIVLGEIRVRSLDLGLGAWHAALEVGDPGLLNLPAAWALVVKRRVVASLVALLARCRGQRACKSSWPSERSPQSPAAAAAAASATVIRATTTNINARSAEHRITPSLGRCRPHQVATTPACAANLSARHNRRRLGCRS